MAWVSGAFRRWSARRRYFAADQDARQAWEDFADLNPVARREALLWAADCERRSAETASGFAAAAEVDKDGYTLAQSHQMAALLLTMVADTELEPGRPWRHTRRSALDDDPMVAAVLAELAGTSGLSMRGELTMTLFNMVAGQVGGQAAEALAASVAYGYYRLSGQTHAHAQGLIGPDRPAAS